MTRRVLWAEFFGTAGLLTVGGGFRNHCERLVNEHCPVPPTGTRKLHCPLNHPVKDTEEEIMPEFRATRDEVNERVTRFSARLRNESAV